MSRGAGPVGLAAAASARLLGAAVVMIGDFNQERLEHAKRVGFEPIDLGRHDRLGEMIAAVVGVPEVDAAIDAVGFEARGHGGGEQPAGRAQPDDGDKPAPPAPWAYRGFM